MEQGAPPWALHPAPSCQEQQDPTYWRLAPATACRQGDYQPNLGGANDLGPARALVAQARLPGELPWKGGQGRWDGQGGRAGPPGKLVGGLGAPPHTGTGREAAFPCGASSPVRLSAERAGASHHGVSWPGAWGQRVPSGRDGANPHLVRLPPCRRSGGALRVAGGWREGAPSQGQATRAVP